MPLSRTLNYNLYFFKIDLDFLSNSKNFYGYLKGTKYSEFPYMTLKQQQYSQLRKNTREKKDALFSTARWLISMKFSRIRETGEYYVKESW